ncbi:hypothetical protein CSKR_101909 [Clonorchis sinensis]|uniref:Uncharacterized protein n=1 Tax=Clonorchis sinensis TaxID=79923 RepID=A0A419QC26_CLOSI|nr:hypothetical protein CSKR_101909 [Clonorchis sinensis]
MCCTRPPHVPVVIFEISRYMYIRNALLIRQLNVLHQAASCSSRDIRDIAIHHRTFKHPLQEINSPRQNIRA